MALLGDTTFSYTPNPGVLVAPPVVLVISGEAFGAKQYLTNTQPRRTRMEQPTGPPGLAMFMSKSHQKPS